MGAALVYDLQVGGSQFLKLGFECVFHREAGLEYFSYHLIGKQFMNIYAYIASRIGGSRAELTVIPIR